MEPPPVTPEVSSGGGYVKSKSDSSTPVKVKEVSPTSRAQGGGSSGGKKSGLGGMGSIRGGKGIKGVPGISGNLFVPQHRKSKSLSAR